MSIKITNATSANFFSSMFVTSTVSRPAPAALRLCPFAVAAEVLGVPWPGLAAPRLSLAASAIFSRDSRSKISALPAASGWTFACLTLVF